MLLAEGTVARARSDSCRVENSRKGHPQSTAMATAAKRHCSSHGETPISILIRHAPRTVRPSSRLPSVSRIAGPGVRAGANSAVRTRSRTWVRPGIPKRRCSALDHGGLPIICPVPHGGQLYRDPPGMHACNCAQAASSGSRRASRAMSTGTHSGNGDLTTTCLPESLGVHGIACGHASTRGARRGWMVEPVRSGIPIVSWASSTWPLR